MFFERK